MIFLCVLMLSPFTFLLFLLVFRLHIFITLSCSLGVLATAPTYQCFTWVQPFILRWFLVHLVYRGTSNGLVGSSSLRVISSSFTLKSFFSMRGENFLLVVVRLRAGLLAFACAAICTSAILRVRKDLIRVFSCDKFTPLIHSYSYSEYTCIKHLYYFHRSWSCLE